MPMTPRTLTVPELSLVLLVGPSGAGKSTFAAKHFSPWEVLSSDHYRGVLTNDPGTLDANTLTFEVLEYLAAKRLERGLLTVIDATSVRREDRAKWVKLARRFHVLPVAIVLDVPADVAHARNTARPDRTFGKHVVRNQVHALRRSVRGLKREGFRYIHRLEGVDAIENVAIERPRPWTDRRDERGPFDLIGDIHGCREELDALLDALGYELRQTDGTWSATHPEGRRLVFLGDLVDRGPDSPGVLARVMDLVEHGPHLCVPGNHEVKLVKWLRGKRVSPKHGLQETIDQLSACDEAFHQRVLSFLDGLISHFVLDDGALVVAHAGMTERLMGRASGKVRQFALFGETTGEIDAFGLPVRHAWAEEYRGKPAVVYGHTPVPYAEWVNNTLCIDTGCVFGGALTALRWPERELVSVPATAVHCEPVKPLDARPTRPHADLPHIDDVLKSSRVATRFRGSVRIPAEQAAAALEVVARFAVNPRWLIHLPPTMSPSETSMRDGLLEHPDEAFAYYRRHGVDQVVCEEKHMGSRALVLVGRTPEALAARFGVPDPEPGLILSRRGRRFFGDRVREHALLDRVRAAVDAEDLWTTLDTDWLLLDAELMPWSTKAMGLLESQYAPVGQAARRHTAAATDLLRHVAARHPDDPEVVTLQGRLAQGQRDATAYTDAYRRYCWDVRDVRDLRLAPFHLLASEGKVHHDQPHAWHMETLAGLARHDEVLVATPWRTVDLADEAAVADAIAWWTAHTDAGGEGMVVKPASFLAWHKGRLVQPALKVRGREYLRIIYGPSYTAHLDRLRKRGVGRKRKLAYQEFLLGLEGLERFVERAPLADVHACVTGILALEAEPVDPRL
jgi:protein phosphatase